MTPAWRARVLALHRWSGLTLGLLLVFLALTGAALAFRHQLQPLAEPQTHLAGCRQPLTLDALVTAARIAHPSGRRESVLIEQDSTVPTVVRFSDDAALQIDPCTGQVVQSLARWGGLFGRLEQLHRFRFLEDSEVANFITGSAATVLALVLVGGGVALWWPARGGSLAQAAKLRPHLRGRGLELNLHKVLGLWGGVVLLAVALTSLPLAFKWTRSLINVAVGAPAAATRPRPAPAPAHAQPLSVGALWERALAVLDHPSRAVLAWPRKNAEPVEIYAIERGAPHAEARSYVYLDARTGAVLRNEPYASSSLGNRIYRTAGAIHAGEYGLVLQWLEFLGALVVPALAWTGMASWLRGWRRRRAGRPLRVRVLAVRDETLDVRSYALAPAAGKLLPAFSAGAHVDVLLPGGLLRSFSICSDPADRTRYVIAVKRCAESRGGSRAMHEAVHAGQEILVSRPRNHFALERRSGRVLLLAGGIGITPLLAMARQLLREGRAFELHYFVHSMAQAAFVDVLAEPMFRPHVRIHAALGREDVGTTLWVILQRRGEGEHLYLCGPEGFMQAARRAAAPVWPAAAVHVEHFRGQAGDASPGEPFELELQRSHRRLRVAAGERIVDALARCGVAVTTSCREGVCGSCVAPVLEGSCDHRDAFLSAAERRAGDRIVMCVSRARGGTLVLDI